MSRRPLPRAAVDPAAIHADSMFAFVQRALRRARMRRARVLDVGCGSGRLSQRLVRAGHRVIAIDTAADAVRETRRRGVPAIHADVAAFDAGPFDALVFGLSLHHVRSLARVLGQAHALLRPGGLLIADEFARERADRNTAAWFYETVGLIEAAGLFQPDPHAAHGHGAPPSEPLARWRAHHAHDPPLHTGRAMRAAIARRFRIVESGFGPHLFRYPARRLRPGAAGMRVVRQVFDAEVRAIAARRVRPLGLRMVARRDRRRR